MIIDSETWIKESPALYDLAKQIAEYYRQELEREKAVASGQLKSFDWDVELQDSDLLLAFQLPKHWHYIENGRDKSRVRKGNPFLYEVLKTWIQDKGLSQGVVEDNKFAHALAKAIHKSGYFRDGGGNNIGGKHVLEHAMQNAESLRNKFVDTAASIVGSSVSRDVLVELDGIKTVKIKL